MTKQEIVDRAQKYHKGQIKFGEVLNSRVRTKEDWKNFLEVLPSEDPNYQFAEACLMAITETLPQNSSSCDNLLF